MHFHSQRVRPGHKLTIQNGGRHRHAAGLFSPIRRLRIGQRNMRHRPGRHPLAHQHLPVQPHHRPVIQKLIETRRKTSQRPIPLERRAKIIGAQGLVSRHRRANPRKRRGYRGRLKSKRSIPKRRIRRPPGRIIKSRCIPADRRRRRLRIKFPFGVGQARRGRHSTGRRSTRVVSHHIG